MSAASFAPWRDGLRRSKMQKADYPCETCAPFPFLLVMFYLGAFKDIKSFQWQTYGGSD